MKEEEGARGQDEFRRKCAPLRTTNEDRRLDPIDQRSLVREKGLGLDLITSVAVRTFFVEQATSLGVGGLLG